MTKYDIKKDPKYPYGKKNRTWELVEVPIQRFIAIEGHGDPNTSRRYVEAVEALYPVAYAIKAASKRELGRDFVVGPWKGSGGPTTRRCSSPARRRRGRGGC